MNTRRQRQRCINPKQHNALAHSHVSLVAWSSDQPRLYTNGASYVLLEEGAVNAEEGAVNACIPMPNTIWEKTITPTHDELCTFKLAPSAASEMYAAVLAHEPRT